MLSNVATKSVMADFKFACLQKVLFAVVILMAILSSQIVHTYRISGKKSVDARGSTNAKHLQLPVRSSSTTLYAAKKQKKAHPVVPEFSRVLNVGQVSNFYNTRRTCAIFDDMQLTTLDQNDV